MPLREHGIVLPEPYRTFVAEITDGSYRGLAERQFSGRSTTASR
ncbi:hypothetical protein [Kitasatospora acidiphila]|nr:hypothetical protein [Kitasatospora acidiphila]